MTPDITPMLTAKQKAARKKKAAQKAKQARIKRQKQERLRRQRRADALRRSNQATPNLGPGGALIGGHRVTIQSYTGELRVTGYLGEEGAKLVGGFGSWEVVDRPRDVALTQWSGRPPFEMDLPILLDGFAVNESMERECITLERLALPTASDETPPQLRVFGAVPRAGRHWCVQSLDWGDAIRRSGDGHRIRQTVTLRLIEYVAPDRLLRPAKGKAKPKYGKPYRVKKGDTLKSIAKRRLGKATRWKEIARLNKIRDPKADKKLKVAAKRKRVLKMPAR